MNDYGLGFYCTEDIELAKEWACKTPKDGFANMYSIDKTELDILNLTSGDWHILNWLAILLENRSFEIGNPVAKDAKAFLNGGIPIKALAEAMKPGKLGEQICIRSKAAFSKLRYIDATLANGQEYYIKRTARDTKAREEYLKLLNLSARDKDSIYILDILRQEWKNDDERLR